MTEQEWEGCADTRQMLAILQGLPASLVSERKWWLIFFNHDLIDLTFAPVDAPDEERDQWPLIRAKCDVGFKFADGEATARDVLRARFPDMKEPLAKTADSAVNHVVAEFDCLPEKWLPGAAARMCEMVRDIVHNPFRSPPRILRPLSWTIESLARAAYEERMPSGELDPVRLAVVADALEEAGCNDTAILDHLHSRKRCPNYGREPLLSGRCSVRLLRHMGLELCGKCEGSGWLPLEGPHYRGCHVLDAILGRS